MPAPALPLTSSGATSPWLRRAVVIGLVAITASACGGRSVSPGATSDGTPRVGPASGSVVVVGGGAQGPEIFARFIELAGGPDALIVEVPTAGSDSVDMSTVGRGLRAAGARNVVAYHATSRAVADADTFVAKIANARGVWFGGGRHYRLVNSYMGTKSQRAFEAVLARGGVVGGSSAGASILGSYLVRGAPSNDNRIMNHPQYLEGFAYLRGTAIDQHVVARERLPDLYDSVTSRRPDLLAISEDEGTAWVVRGDTAEIIGRNKAFVYNGRDANDTGRPFLTLHPGDRYNLGTRRVMSRAGDGTGFTTAFVDSVFAPYRDAAHGGATVLVARGGKVLVNRSYGVPIQPRFTPETGAPLMPLGELSMVLNSALGPDSAGTVSQSAVRRVQSVGGTQRLQFETATRRWRGNVDDLYRFDLGRFTVRPGTPDTMALPAAFAVDRSAAGTRQTAFAGAGGTGGAWLRLPEQRAVVLVLFGDGAADARTPAERLVGRLLTAN
ncbi:MAG TPA: Type 1 glutamine amidotransferase-like domain-containing protein [Gemmatimonas sp.]|uniref:cyanophycinase n=1 Tax=Gemmatimonas sp. TaxID=1962908 RepID=UPI002ED99CE1